VTFKFDQALDAVLIRPIAWTYMKIFPEFFRKRINPAAGQRAFTHYLCERCPARPGTTRRTDHGAPCDQFETVGLAACLMWPMILPRFPPHTEDFGQNAGCVGRGRRQLFVSADYRPVVHSRWRGLGRRLFRLRSIAWYSYNPHNLQWVQYAELGLELVDGKSTTMKTTDELKKSSIDYYAALRSAYRQYRAKEIRTAQPCRRALCPIWMMKAIRLPLNPTPRREQNRPNSAIHRGRPL